MMFENDELRMSFDDVEQINKAIKECTLSEQRLFSTNRTTKETHLVSLISQIQTTLEKAHFTFQKADHQQVKFLSDDHLNALLNNYNWITDLGSGDGQMLINKLNKFYEYAKTDHYLPMNEAQVIEYNRTVRQKSMSDAELLMLPREVKEQNLIDILEAANNAVGTGGHQTLTHYEFTYAVDHIPVIPDQELNTLLSDRNLPDNVISNAIGENAISQRARIEAVINNIYGAALWADETQPEPEPEPEQPKSEHSTWAQRQINKIMHPFRPNPQSPDLDR